MNPAGWARFLRQPPDFLISAARILLPSHRLRRAIFDPLRSPGFKPKAAAREPITEQQQAILEAAFSEEVEFLADLEAHIDPALIISH
jgi:hypothetical protein